MKKQPRLPFFKALPAGVLTLFVSLSPASGAFVHPGVYHNADDLAFMRGKIEARAEPWYGAWTKLQGEYYSKLNWKPHAVAEWDANKNAYMEGDAVAAYSHALQWALAGNSANADKAIEILNAWSSTLQHINGTTSQGMVVWGWNGCHLVNAAELLRFYVQPDGKTSGWSAEDIAQFQKMLAIGQEVIKDFMPSFNGNWDAAMMNTMLCTAIFNDDQAMFDKVIDHFNGNYEVANRHHGKYGHMTAYILPTGQCQESGRDQGHVQMGLGNYASLCEAAWKQGVDLYSAYENRLLLGYEYTAKYMLGKDDVPFTALPPLQWTKISADQRGLFGPIYESVYQHYVYRKGLEMPFTGQIITNSAVTLVARKTAGNYRPEPSSPNSGICWGTLTMFKGPEKP